MTRDDRESALATSSVLRSFSGSLCSLASLAAGSHGISAQYSGDGNHGTSASATLAQTVGRVTTTTVVTASINPSGGQPVTFTATVAGSAPTGTVVFRTAARRWAPEC